MSDLTEGTSALISSRRPLQVEGKQAAFGEGYNMVRSEVGDGQVCSTF